jgi:hypothetical protein
MESGESVRHPYTFTEKSKSDLKTVRPSRCSMWWLAWPRLGMRSGSGILNYFWLGMGYKLRIELFVKVLRADTSSLKAVQSTRQ